MRRAPSEGTSEHPTCVFANYVRMNDPGVFTHALNSELERLWADVELPPETVLSLTMIEPNVIGPTRRQLDDERPLGPLAELFERNRRILRDAANG